MDVLQPCVTYNKWNTFKWFKENTYPLEDSYAPTDRMEALRRASEVEKLPLGIFYEKTKPTFEERLATYETSREPLFRRRPDLEKLSRLIASKRGRT